MRAPRAAWKHVLVWAGVSVVAWAVAGLWLGRGGLDTVPSVPTVRTVSAASIEPVVAADPAEPVAFPDKIGRGETLSDVLGRNGFSAREIHDVALALSGVMDVRKLRAGNELSIRYDEAGEAEHIQIDRHDLTRIDLTRSDLGWQSLAEAVDLTARVVTLSGSLEGSLFASMGRLGESAPLTIAFANVFAWDFDFYTQSREGDQFSIVFEKLYRDGEFVAYGDLRAARYVSYQTGERVFSAYLYTDPDGNRDYYNPEGKSMKKAFLRAPLDYQRISSGFSYSRLHPVHKTRRPHLGVDYAAPTGTPVYSVAAGTVTGRSRGKANGNMVRGWNGPLSVTPSVFSTLGCRQVYRGLVCYHA